MDDDDPRLLASRCTSCGTYAFPRQAYFCRNPDCDGATFDEVALSRRGRVWSWSTNHYPPPAPYIAPDPFVPYTVAAVALEEERLVVLGQLADGVDPSALRAGMEVELTLGTLFEDDEAVHIMWQWRPV
jgi:uncharacterized OB-fold protein